MSDLNGKIDSITKLCKAFGSNTRVEMFLKLLEKKTPVKIEILDQILSVAIFISYAILVFTYRRRKKK